MGCTDRLHFVRPAGAVLGAVLLLSAAVPAVATTQYTLERIARAGDKIGDQTIRGPLTVAGLTDSGQIVITRQIEAGGVLLMRYADGRLTPIVVTGQDGPGGKWPNTALLNTWVEANRHGSVAFSTQISIADVTTYGVFTWNGQTGKLSTVALAGMPAADRVLQRSQFGGAAINNYEETLFLAPVLSASGQTRYATLFLGRDGRLLPAAMPDEALPGGVRIVQSFPSPTSLTDAGVAAVHIVREGDPRLTFSSHVWESGVLTPVATVGAPAPGGDTIASAPVLRLSNRDRIALVALFLRKTPRQAGLYRWVDGQLQPLATPGQEMPEGGRLRSVTLNGSLNAGQTPGFSVSRASEAGEYAFMATLEDGSLAAYRLGASGKLTLILKSGAITNLGKITLLHDDFGRNRLAINSKGQVALNVTIGGDRTETIVLLTPVAP